MRNTIKKLLIVGAGCLTLAGCQPENAVMKAIPEIITGAPLKLEYEHGSFTFQIKAIDTIAVDVIDTTSDISFGNQFKCTKNNIDFTLVFTFNRQQNWLNTVNE